MKKILTLAFTISALALGSSFADCKDGGSCSGKKTDKKKDKPEAVHVINF